MFENVDRYVDFLCKKNINSNQFLICTIIHLKDYKNAIKYCNEYGPFNISEIKDLIKKDFLIATKEGTYELDEFFVTPKFTEELFVDSEEGGEELWDIYPKWLFLDGKKVSAESCDKELLIEKYDKKIKKNIKLHKKIIGLIEKYKINNEYADMGIEKFVASEHWNLLEDEYKDTGEQKYGEQKL